MDKFNARGEYKAPQVSKDKARNTLGEVFDDIRYLYYEEYFRYPYEVILAVLQKTYDMDYNDASDIVDFVEKLYNIA